MQLLGHQKERFLFFVVSPKVQGQQNQTALELVPSFYAMDEDSSCLAMFFCSCLLGWLVYQDRLSLGSFGALF